MVLIDFSPKLKQYFAKIKEATKREIIIQFVEKFPVEGMAACFSAHEEYILIIVDKNKLNDIEKSLAHEATHGYLLYSRGYVSAKPLYQLDNSILQSTGILFTMVEDIVVNKKIYEEGFSPFSTVYPTIVQQEIDALKKGNDFYQQFNSDPIFKKRFIAFRYVMAWGFIKYFDIEIDLKNALSEFISLTKERYYDSSIIAEEIISLIIDNDIFTVNGHKTVIEKTLIAWNIESMFELVTYI